MRAMILFIFITQNCFFRVNTSETGPQTGLPTLNTKAISSAVLNLKRVGTHTVDGQDPALLWVP